MNVGALKFGQMPPVPGLDLATPNFRKASRAPEPGSQWLVDEVGLRVGMCVYIYVYGCFYIRWGPFWVDICVCIYIYGCFYIRWGPFWVDICVCIYIYVCRTFGVYLRKALVAIFNTMLSGAGPGLADLKFSKKFTNFRNFRNFKYF